MDALAKKQFPFSSYDGIEFTTPLFISPTILLSFIVLLSVGRLIHTRASPWLDFNVQSRSRSWSASIKLLITLCIGVLLTLVVDCGVIIAKAVNSSVWISNTLTFYETASLACWILCLWSLLDELHKFGQVYWIQYGFFFLAVLAETCVGWLWALTVKHPESGASLTFYEQILLGCFMTRYILQWLLVILSIVHIFSRPSLAESTPLLNGNGTSNADYGAAPVTTTPVTTEKPRSAFSDFFKKMGELMPFIWPQNNIRLQSLVMLSFALMVLGLVINACVPFQIGYVVDHIGKGKFAWAAVLIYIGFKFLQGGSGLIQCVQNFLWVPVNQHLIRDVSIKLFEHLHLLSLSFHINRKTGEVLRTMDRGTSSVVQLLSQILFQIFPAIANILVAAVLFTVTFAPAYGCIVFVTMGLYLYVTITMTEWRTKFRRDMIELDNSARTKAVDSLLNFETVKYYGNSDYEVQRYRDAIVEYQKADWKSSFSLNVLNLAQNTVITAGLLAGCLLFAYEVYLDRLTAGDFVVFVSYISQLYAPLHWFGTYYRMIQTNFIDMEKMLDLFKEQQTVKDIPGAPDLIIKEGNIVFDNVTFTYDNRQTALNGISFTAPAGKSVALVGPSGSGKSTIMRLLFRFYDPTSGSVSIDGQNICNVKQASLRHNIGVVPQDCVLFNDTIMYNLQYGDIHASKEDVYQAAKAAQIHDKILSFPDGYETKVGERGLRLSTGEKQRVAIGRTILKNPPIILLDEATSSLDTLTERQIQQALANVTKDRTTVVVAHRLSTIINADLILVIKDGRVAESGTHEELLKQGGDSNSNRPGIYWEMWQKQLREDNDTDSTITLGENKTKTHTDKDGNEDNLAMENETPEMTTTEIEKDSSGRGSPQQDQHQQQQYQQQDDAIASQQSEDSVTIINNNNNNNTNNNNEDNTPVMQNPTTLPHLDIPSTTDDDNVVPAAKDEVEETIVSSPVGTSDIATAIEIPDTPAPDTPTLDTPEGPDATEIPTGSTTQQQDTSKNNKQEKPKPKSKNKKNRKRKSTRNSTTFSR